LKYQVKNTLLEVTRAAVRHLARAGTRQARIVEIESTVGRFPIEADRLTNRHRSTQPRAFGTGNRRMAPRRSLS